MGDHVCGTTTTTTATTPPKELPYTGSNDVVPATATGLLILATGAALVARYRQHRKY